MRYDKKDYYGEEDFNRDMGIESSGAGEDSPQNGKRKKRKNKKERKKKSPWKTAIIILLCLGVLGACGYALANNYVVKKLDKVEKEEVAKEDWGIDPKVAEDLKGYKNIAVLGVDTIEYAGQTDENSRSDGIIIASINKETKEVKLISVYRDSYLDLEESGYHVIDKVTHAHAYGGPVNTVRALNRNLDLNIDDYIRVNWRTVADVSDSMGGLELEVTDNTLYELNRCAEDSARALSMDYTPVANAGMQLLDGTQVVGFCRMRMADGDDFRAERMRQVINTAFEKAKKMKLSELNHTADVALSEILTSMSTDTMMDMILDLTSYEIGESKGWPYEFQGGLIRGVSYDVPITLKSNVIQLHKELFNQKDYEPTNTVLMINEQVKMDSGIYGDEEINYELLDEYSNTFGANSQYQGDYNENQDNSEGNSY